MEEIATALVKAQREFGPALKTHTNPAFRSKYADLSACIEAVIDALNNHGIYLAQPTSESEKGVTVETVFLHESGELFSSGKLFVPASKNDPQGYGSALTYARRYSLMTACGIAPEDDDGIAASKPQRATSTAKQDAPVGNIDLRGLSMEIVGLVKEGKPRQAYERVSSEKLDDVQSAALWAMLGGGTRGAIGVAKAAVPS